MPNTREKLIELLDEVQHYGTSTNPGLNYVYNGSIADHLIANGVTIISEHWATEQAYKNGLEDGKPKWISVSERLPKEDGNYLVVQKGLNNRIRQDVLWFAKDGRKVDKYDFHREWKNVWYYYDSEWGHITLDSVTHWMPLPEPPKGE